MRLISSIQLKNFLSFSENSKRFDMGSLNVLIGTNGSGKSNFLDAIDILRSLAKGDTIDIFSKGGGVKQWVFDHLKDKKVSLNCLISEERFGRSIRHLFEFQAEDRSFSVRDERVENLLPDNNNVDPYIYYRLNNKNPVVNTRNFGERKLSKESINFDLSILNQRKDPEIYPELYLLSELYSNIRLYRNWEFGRNALVRNSQPSDLRNTILEEDFSNLCLILSKLFRNPQTKRAILEALKDAYTGITDIHIDIANSSAQLFISEENVSISSKRISDGTLRYLILLTILLDPSPPPLICIEEPEIGLHPDLISKLASLLVNASSKTQLIVTTHSELLVNAFSKNPEIIVVCEKEDGQTTLKRLEPERLKIWLEDYKHQLGDVWLRGELGGVRW